jgi:HK97 family phage portal protein
MLNFLRNLRGTAAPDQKRSRVGPLIALHEAGRPVWTPRDYAALAREGYERNPVVHRCVRLIAEAAAQMPLIAKVGTREMPDHPALTLIDRPNPRQGGIAFREMLYGHLLVAGNAYVEAAGVGAEPRELFALRPDRMRLVPGRDGWPEAYDYTVGGETVRFRQDGGALAPILHLTLFHPVDDHYGLSPIEAAACSLDIHNAASNWHKALLDNAARPSGALVYDGPDGAGLTDTQFERLKAELEESFQGARNAGRPLLLEGGLDWNQLCSKDTEGTTASARTLCTTQLPQSPRHTATSASRRPNRARATVSVANLRSPRTTAARRA